MARGEIIMDGTPKDVWAEYHDILAREG